MMTEKDIPLAKDSYTATRESDEALNTAIHNIIIYIKESCQEGSYECTYPFPIPTTFSNRIQEIFTKKGYKVDFRSIERTDEKNSLGCHVENMKVFISWNNVL